jgi:Glyoxalase/Bleomycin resistance protein/Dioxygenase superfamily
MRLHATTLLVRDYDEAIGFFTEKLGFHLAEDTDLGGGKRWVRVTPSPGEAGILLAQAVGAAQHPRSATLPAGVWRSSCTRMILDPGTRKCSPTACTFVRNRVASPMARLPFSKTCMATAGTLSAPDNLEAGAADAL